MTCYETDGPLCQGYGWLAKLDADDNILWQKGFKDTEGYAAFSPPFKQPMTMDSSLSAADVNGDGKIGPAGVIFILQESTGSR
jgi:hypothetical protein